MQLASMISILILTLNEENNLPAYLETCKWSDDTLRVAGKTGVSEFSEVAAQLS